jgi:hypothetical protein
MRPVETIIGMGGGGIKENLEGVNSTMIYYKTFVNVTVYPQYNNNMIMKSLLKA